MVYYYSNYTSKTKKNDPCMQCQSWFIAHLVLFLHFHWNCNQQNIVNNVLHLPNYTRCLKWYSFLYKYCIQIAFKCCIHNIVVHTLSYTHGFTHIVLHTWFCTAHMVLQTWFCKHGFANISNYCFATIVF